MGSSPVGAISGGLRIALISGVGHNRLFDIDS
jgi:hypothetical protein